MATVDTPTFRLQVYQVHGQPCSFVMTSRLNGWKLRAVVLTGTKTVRGRTLWTCGRCSEVQESRGALLQSWKRPHSDLEYERLICHACYLEQSSGSDHLQLVDLPDCFTPRWRTPSGWPGFLDNQN